MYRYFELYKKNELQIITYCTSNDCIQSGKRHNKRIYTLYLLDMYNK